MKLQRLQQLGVAISIGDGRRDVNVGLIDMHPSECTAVNGRFVVV